MSLLCAPPWAWAQAGLSWGSWAVPSKARFLVGAEARAGLAGWRTGGRAEELLARPQGTWMNPGGWRRSGKRGGRRAQPGSWHAEPSHARRLVDMTSFSGKAAPPRVGEREVDAEVERASQDAAGRRRVVS